MWNSSGCVVCRKELWTATIFGGTNKYWWRGMNFQLPGTNCPQFSFKCTLGKLQSPNKMVHSSSRTPWFVSMIVWRRLTLAKVRMYWYWATMRCRDFLWWRVFWTQTHHCFHHFHWGGRKRLIIGDPAIDGILSVEKHSQVEKRNKQHVCKPSLHFRCSVKNRESDLQFVCRPRKNHVQCKPCLPSLLFPRLRLLYQPDWALRGVPKTLRFYRSANQDSHNHQDYQARVFNPISQKNPHRNWIKLPPKRG